MFSVYIPALSNFLLLPLILTKLGLSSFGELSFYIAVSGIAAVVFGVGLPESTLYHAGQQKISDKIGKPSATALLLGFCLSVFTFLFLGIVLSFDWLNASLNGVEFTLTALIAAITLSSNIWRSLASGLELWAVVVTERILSSMLRVGLTLAFFWQDGLTTVAILEILLASSLVSMATLAVGVTIRFGFASVFSLDLRATLKPVLKYALAQAPASFMGPLLSRLDQLLLVRMTTPETLGVYATAVSASEGLGLSTAGFRDLTHVQQTKLLDLALIARNVRSAVFIGSVVVGICALGALLSWEQLQNSPYSASLLPFLILLGSSTIGAPGSIAGAVLMARGKPAKRSAALFVGLLTNVVLLVILAPELGALGASFATALSGLVAGSINVLFCRYKLSVPVSVFFGRIKNLS